MMSGQELTPNFLSLNWQSWKSARISIFLIWKKQIMQLESSGIYDFSTTNSSKKIYHPKVWKKLLEKKNLLPGNVNH